MSASPFPAIIKRDANIMKLWNTSVQSTALSPPCTLKKNMSRSGCLKEKALKRKVVKSEI